MQVTPMCSSKNVVEMVKVTLQIFSSKDTQHDENLQIYQQVYYYPEALHKYY